MLIKEFDANCAEKCALCDENKADAIWTCAKDIYVCKRCALDFLPQLMADAIVGGTDKKFIKSATGATNNLTKETYILKRFHSAFSSALLRKFRDGDKK